MRVGVKLCGVRRSEDARLAIRAGADAIGINFVAGSPRYIGGLSDAQALIAATAAPVGFRWVGVYVNTPRDLIAAQVRAVGLWGVQLHGEETTEYVDQLRRELPAGVAVWKAFRVATVADIAPIAKYANCDGWLLDAKVSGVRGGSGQSFDWSILEGFSRSRPLVLSGGLSPKNVAVAVTRVRPDWVDVASGVERAAGEKDAGLIEEFVRLVRAQSRP